MDRLESIKGVLHLGQRRSAGELSNSLALFKTIDNMLRLRLRRVGKGELTCLMKVSACFLTSLLLLRLEMRA